MSEAAHSMAFFGAMRGIRVRQLTLLTGAVRGVDHLGGARGNVVLQRS